MTNTKNPRKTPVLDFFGKLFAIVAVLSILGIWLDDTAVAPSIVCSLAALTISGLFMYASILKERS